MIASRPWEYGRQSRLTEQANVKLTSVCQELCAPSLEDCESREPTRKKTTSVIVQRLFADHPTAIHTAPGQEPSSSSGPSQTRLPLQLCTAIIASPSLGHCRQRWGDRYNVCRRTKLVETRCSFGRTQLSGVNESTTSGSGPISPPQENPDNGTRGNALDTMSAERNEYRRRDIATSYVTNQNKASKQRKVCLLVSTKESP